MHWNVFRSCTGEFCYKQIFKSLHWSRKIESRASWLFNHWHSNRIIMLRKSQIRFWFWKISDRSETQFCFQRLLVLCRESWQMLPRIATTCAPLPRAWWASLRTPSLCQWSAPRMTGGWSPSPAAHWCASGAGGSCLGSFDDSWDWHYLKLF